MSYQLNLNNSVALKSPFKPLTKSINRNNSVRYTIAPIHHDPVTINGCARFPLSARSKKRPITYENASTQKTIAANHHMVVPAGNKGRVRKNKYKFTTRFTVKTIIKNIVYVLLLFIQKLFAI